MLDHSTLRVTNSSIKLAAYLFIKIVFSFLNAIKADLETRKSGKIGRMVKNYHTGLNYISKEAYYREESESASFNGHQYSVLEI